MQTSERREVGEYLVKYFGGRVARRRGSRSWVLAGLMYYDTEDDIPGLAPPFLGVSFFFPRCDVVLVVCVGNMI